MQLKGGTKTNKQRTGTRYRQSQQIGTWKFQFTITHHTLTISRGVQFRKKHSATRIS